MLSHSIHVIAQSGSPIARQQSVHGRQHLPDSGQV
jgi:hypothetical protein